MSDGKIAPANGVAIFDHILKIKAICQNPNKNSLRYKANQMKIKSTEQSVDIFISPFKNINQVKVPYRHKHEIFSEKFFIFHEFSLINKNECLKSGM